jgi:hypothetical protein
MTEFAQGSVARMIQVALNEVGVIEGPKDNETKYGAFTKRNFLPWCGSFLMWCAHEAGVTVPNVVSTIDGSNSFKAAKRWFTTPALGDFVFFDFIDDNKTVIQHIGMVIKINSGKSIVTIEGNTSPGGSQSNGGQVMLKTRDLGAKTFVVGYGRPDYKNPT